jgi:hypothetical protein
MRDSIGFLAKSFWYAFQILILSILSIILWLIFIFKLLILGKICPASSPVFICLILLSIVNLMRLFVHKRHQKWIREITMGGFYVNKDEGEND